MTQRFQRFVIDDVDVWHVDTQLQQVLLDVFAYTAKSVVMVHAESARFRLSNLPHGGNHEHEGFLLYIQRSEDHGQIYLQGNFKKCGQRLRVLGHIERIHD